MKTLISFLASKADKLIQAELPIHRRTPDISPEDPVNATPEESWPE